MMEVKDDLNSSTVYHVLTDDPPPPPATSHNGHSLPFQPPSFSLTPPSTSPRPRKPAPTLLHPAFFAPAPTSSKLPPSASSLTFSTLSHPPSSSSIVISECARLLSTSSASQVYHAASVYIHDALTLRAIHHGLSPLALHVYMFRQRWAWYLLMRALCIVQLSLVLIEPPSSFSFGIDKRWSSVIELCILLIFTFDTYLSYVALTRAGFIRSKFRQLKVLALVLCLVDSTWSIIDPLRIFRPTRLVRCFFLTERSGRLRRVLKSLLRAAPVIGNVLFLLLVHVLCFGFLGWMLFAHLEREDPSRLGCRGGDENVLASTEKCYFQDLNAAFINLFILLTNANFPDIMMPSYRTNRWAFFFFVAFLLIGLYLLMQLVLAVIFHTFKNHTVRDVNYYAQRADRAFRAAFYLLGSVEARAALIHINSWLHIMRDVRPELSAVQARLIFRAVKDTPPKPLDPADAAMRDADAAGLRRRSSAHGRRVSAGGGGGAGSGSPGVMEDEVNSVTYDQFKDLCQLIQVRFVSIEDPSEQWRYAPPATPRDLLASPSSLPHHARSPPARLPPLPVEEEKVAPAEPEDANVSLLTVNDSSIPRASSFPPAPVSPRLGDTSILDEVDRSSDDEGEHPAGGEAEEGEEEEEGEEGVTLYRLTCPSFIHPALAWLTARVQGILTRKAVDLVVDVLCTFSTIIIIVQAELVHIEGEGRTRNDADANTVTFLTVIHSLIYATFLVEMGVKLAVMRASYFRSAFRSMDLFLLFLSSLGQLLWYAGTMITPSFYLRPLRLLRLGRGLRRLKAILHTLTLMLPALTPLLVLQCLVFYVFSVLGMAFFAGKVTEATVPVSTGLDYAINNYYANTFDDVLHAYVTLFELLIGNNCQHTIARTAHSHSSHLGAAACSTHQPHAFLTVPAPSLSHFRSVSHTQGTTSWTRACT